MVSSPSYLDLHVRKEDRMLELDNLTHPHHFLLDSEIMTDAQLTVMLGRVPPISRDI